MCPIELTDWLLECGRKVENPERKHRAREGGRVRVRVGLRYWVRVRVRGRGVRV